VQKEFPGQVTIEKRSPTRLVEVVGSEFSCLKQETPRSVGAVLKLFSMTYPLVNRYKAIFGEAFSDQ
jgi:hypothetical protein